MVRTFHRVLGAIILALYVLLLANLHKVLPGLQFTPSPIPYLGLRNGNPASGWLVALGLLVVSVVCFVWPRQLMWRFSPRIPPDYDYLLTESFWYAVGYATLVVGIGVLLLFRSPP